jgi:hypothetical protein
VDLSGYTFEIMGTNLDDITLRETTLRGMDFNSDQDYMRRTSAVGVPTGNSPYTMMAWIYPDKHDTRCIMGWGSTSGTSTFNYIRLEDNNQIRVWWNSDDIEVTTGSLLGGWHHVALTYSGSAVRLYIDGVDMGGKDDTTHYTNNSHVYIGSYVTNTSYRYDGDIDEVAIFNRALDPTEVQDAMNRIDGDETGLVLWYPMDQDTITDDGTALDMSGYGNDATMYGFLKWEGAVVEEIYAPVVKLGDELKVLSGSDAKKPIRREYVPGKVGIETAGATYNQSDYNIYEAVDGIKTGNDNGWAVSGLQGEEGMFITGLAEADNMVITSGIDRPAHNPIDIEVYYTVDETPTLRQSIWLPVTNIDIQNLDSAYFAEGNRVMVNGISEVDIFDLVFDRVKMTALKIKINDANASDHNFVMTEVEIFGTGYVDVFAGTSELEIGAEYDVSAETIAPEDLYAAAMAQEDVFEFILDVTKDEMEADIPAQQMNIIPYSIAGPLENVDVTGGKIKILGYEVVPPAEIYLDGELVTLGALKSALTAANAVGALLKTVAGCSVVNTPDEGWKVTSQDIRFYSSGGLKYTVKGDLEAIDYLNGTVTIGGKVIQLLDTDPSAEGFTVSGDADFYVQPIETSLQAFEEVDVFDAMMFDGTDDKITGTMTTVPLTSNITLAAWVKSPGGGEGSPRIVEVADATGSDTTSAALCYDTDGSLRAWVTEAGTGTRGGEIDYSGIHYVDDKWHYIVYTYDGAEGKLYIDGPETDSD